MEVLKIRSPVSFRTIGAAFLGFYLLLIVLMFVYVGHSPSQTVFLDQLGAQPYDTDSSARTLHFPKKPDQEQDTPCFYNIQPFQRPVFHQIIPSVYLVSAFYNTGVVAGGSRAEIKILALLEGDTPPNVPIYCLYREHNTFISVRGKFSAFNSDNDGKYQVYILTCPITMETAREEMCKVYISLQPSLSGKNYITMPLLPIEEKRYPFSFAICVPPLRGVVPQNKLIEFIELYNILGADHFVFYRYEGDSLSNYSNPNLDEILAYYEKVGLATVHPWRLPVPAEDVWHYGWKLAMHHCLLTNTWTYKYLLFSDIDEFLIPRGDTSHWSDMMYKIDDDKYSGYCFYSSFFPPEAGELFLTMASLERTQVVNSQHMKCMVRPELVIEMGNQDVVKWTEDGVSTMEVNETIALIHHYKICDKTIQGNCHDMVKDDVIVKFKQNLHSNHKSVMKYIMSSKEDQS